MAKEKLYRDYHWVIPPKLTWEEFPRYIGNYQPHSRAGDFTGELINPVTGEVRTPPSRTKQSFVAECDINNIIKSFKVTGQISHINAQAALGRYVDLTTAPDFQEALHTVQAARDSFATLPSQVRARFENDPAQFLAFMGNPANQDEIIKMGLAKDTRPPPAPPKAPEVPEPPKTP